MKSLEILHETGRWLVVNKPTRLSVHNDVENILSVLKLMKPGVSFFPVHRLDAETSGVLLVAKDAGAAASLSAALQSDSSRKIYHAVLRGSLKTETARWMWALTDKAEGRKNPQGVSKDRKECTTLVSVLQRSSYFTLVACEILTGRQHQIRKHAALAGHAIVGDSRYNDPKYNARMAQMYASPRMFLHAAELRVTIEGTEFVFMAPVPGEFVGLLGA